MRKQQINILSSIQFEELRSIKSCRGYCDDFSDIEAKLSNEIESNPYSELDYQISILEHQKKFADASNLVIESIPLKKKLSSTKKTVFSTKFGTHFKDLCGVLLNWVSYCIKSDKRIQAYSILGSLQKITDKKYPLKCIGRKTVRMKIYL